MLLLDVVAEVTQPSLGVGYEIGRAVAMNKRILCLYRPQENKREFFNQSCSTQILVLSLYLWVSVLSAMIRGAHDGTQVIVKDYGEEELGAILQGFFGSS